MPEDQFDAVIKQEVSIQEVISLPAALAMTDDRPANEYYLLRQLVREILVSNGTLPCG